LFSNRLPPNLAPNRLARAIERMRAERRPIVDLTQSNPTTAGFAYPADLLAPLASSRALIYEPYPFGSFDARRAVSADYARRGVHVAPERIVLTASTSEAYTLMFKLLADPGDEVLVPRPSYPLFDHLTRLDAVVARPYDLEYHVGWSIDIGSVERAITRGTRALLVVTPNNPTGSFLKEAELDAIASLCAERHIALVSDEVFADYELEPGAALSAGRVLDRKEVLAFALGGLSKSAGLPQVKLGWIAVGGPDALVDAAMRRLELECDTYLSVSTPVQAAAAELLDRAPLIRAQVQQRVRANYQTLGSIAAAAPACRVLKSEGGWYGVVQVPSIQSEEDLVLDLLENDGLLTHPGYFFDFPREAYLIVSLLAPERVFSDAIGCIVRHFDCTAGLRGHSPDRRGR